MIKNISFKKITSSALLWLIPAGLTAQSVQLPKVITVKGTVEFINPHQKENKVFLYKDLMSGKSRAVDSAIVNQQKKSFSFRLHQDHPGIYHIDAFNWDQASFWSDANVTVHMRGYDTSKIHMEIPHYNFVEGSMDNNFINLYEQINDLNYLRTVDEYNEKYYANKYKDKDSAWAHYLASTKRYDSLMVDYHKRMDVLMRMYKDRPVTLYALRMHIGPESQKEYTHTLTLLDHLIKKYSWLTEAKEAKETIITNRAMAQKVKPGMPVPNIAYPDLNGQLHGLQAYKGKYLLIDFWASWCGPCRAAIPKVKELYNKYHNKGFDVLSISIDTDKGAWEKAIKEEDMPWQQLLSPNEDKTMKEFQFVGIPTLYLVDPDGKIIQSFTGYSPEAEATIKNILKNGKTAPSSSSGKKTIPAVSF